MPATMHAFIENGAIKERRMIDPDILPAHKFALWRPVLASGDVAFDPTTQKKTGPVTTIEPTRVVDTWTITAKSAGELSTEKDATIGRIDVLLFAVKFDIENRVRVLEGKAQITAAQYRAALKSRL